MLFGYGLKQCQRQGVAFQLDRIRLHFGNVLLQKDAPSEAANRVVVDRGHPHDAITGNMTLEGLASRYQA